MDRPLITVTGHALTRYRERIDPFATEAEIRAVLAGPAVKAAAAFGCRVVRIPHGRIVLELEPDRVFVVTVLSIWPNLPRTLLPASRGGPMPIAHQRALFTQPEGDRP